MVPSFFFIKNIGPPHGDTLGLTNCLSKNSSNYFLSSACGSNDFQDYFDDAKESRVKQVPKNQDYM